MTNIDTVNALLHAVEYDRFRQIESLHDADVLFASFLGPILNDAVSVADWHHRFLQDYADCTYADREYLESSDRVAVRATIHAKGYNWRPFTQRVVESFVLGGRGVSQRFLYGMDKNLVLDKPGTKALEDAEEYPGGQVSATKKATAPFLALVQGEEFDAEAAAELFDPKALLIDMVYGNATGMDAIVEATRALPTPAFGAQHPTNVMYGTKAALIELAVDPSRPRQAYWVHIVEGKIRVIESYWMLREIGFQLTEQERHHRVIIQPI